MILHVFDPGAIELNYGKPVVQNNDNVLRVVSSGSESKGKRATNTKI